MEWPYGTTAHRIALTMLRVPAYDCHRDVMPLNPDYTGFALSITLFVNSSNKRPPSGVYRL